MTKVSVFAGLLTVGLACTASAQDARPREAVLGETAAPALGRLAAGLGVAPGEQAPDPQVADGDGQPVKLLSGAGPRGALLVFYRGGWCPFCNAQIHALTRAFDEFRRRGVSPIAISVDRPEEAARTRASYSIPFPVLSDPDLAAHRAWRVVHEVGSEEYGRLASFGIDLERASGRQHHAIAVPALFVVDASGVVRWGHADPDYKVRPSIAQLLAVLDRLGLTPKEN
jgi:peroxiredoxin